VTPARMLQARTRAGKHISTSLKPDGLIGSLLGWQDPLLVLIAHLLLLRVLWRLTASLGGMKISLPKVHGFGLVCTCLGLELQGLGLGLVLAKGSHTRRLRIGLHLDPPGPCVAELLIEGLRA
jgi:hypothetical protein